MVRVLQELNSQNASQIEWLGGVFTLKQFSEWVGFSAKKHSVAIKHNLKVFIDSGYSFCTDLINQIARKKVFRDGDIQNYSKSIGGKNTLATLMFSILQNTERKTTIKDQVNIIKQSCLWVEKTLNQIKANRTQL